MAKETLPDPRLTSEDYLAAEKLGLLPRGPAERLRWLMFQDTHTPAQAAEYRRLMRAGGCP